MGYVLFVVLFVATLFGLFIWGLKAIDRKQERSIVVGADYRASYTASPANPWQPAEVKTWKVKVDDVKEGYVKYFHYRDDGSLVTHLFEVAPVHRFLMLYKLEE